MIWSKEYLLGYKQLDDDHGWLCQNANLTFKAMEVITDQILREKTMEIFFQTIKGHFDAEESFMQDIKFPDYDAHKMWHDFFLIRLKDFSDMVIKGDVLKSTKDYISNWISYHLTTTDSKIAEYLKGV